MSSELRLGLPELHLCIPELHLWSSHGAAAEMVSEAQHHYYYRHVPINGAQLWNGEFAMPKPRDVTLAC